MSGTDKKCNEYKNIPHSTDMTDDGYMFKSTDDQLQHIISDEEFKVLNKPAEDEVKVIMSSCRNMVQEAIWQAVTHLQRLIDRQVEKITGLENGQEFTNALYAEMRQTITVLKKKANAFMVKYDEADVENVKQAEQIKALEKNLHEECASSAQTIKLLQGQVKAKNDALESIRVNVSRDTTSTQWIEKRAKQGLKGE